jgi:hypothetical protein
MCYEVHTVYWIGYNCVPRYESKNDTKFDITYDKSGEIRGKSMIF